MREGPLYPLYTFTRERVVRAARIYTRNEYAAQAMGITQRHFARLCREHGVESPDERKRRLIK